ncbi:Hypothetical predicted protein [Pelobates cultripes]|uniref:Uncharacterized protein n=1 Tax=Pelobates cultripes TaxID=61616 RepID=A0AAD1TIC6_PELCU|nr:Hypothetical predicted protein [Pelobates cultripes]
METTLYFLTSPDKAKYEALDISCLHWLDLGNLEIELLEFQESSIWKNKLYALRATLKKIEYYNPLELLLLAVEYQQHLDSDSCKEQRDSFSFQQPESTSASINSVSHESADAVHVKKTCKKRKAETLNMYQAVHVKKTCKKRKVETLEVYQAIHVKKSSKKRKAGLYMSNQVVHVKKSRKEKKGAISQHLTHDEPSQMGHRVPAGIELLLLAAEYIESMSGGPCIEQNDSLISQQQETFATPEKTILHEFADALLVRKTCKENKGALYQKLEHHGTLETFRHVLDAQTCSLCRSDCISPFLL